MSGIVYEDLTEEEKYLLAILQDASGVDIAEFCWVDDTSKDGVFRAYDFQVPWYRDTSKFQIDQAGRSVGKSVGIQLRTFAFPFCFPGEELLLTAPQLIHLEPVTKKVEDRLLGVRLSREMLKRTAKSDGLTHRPFEARFRNGARIVGRIPQADGRGVKGQHPLALEMDEAQDYPDAGWVELFETLKFGSERARWRAHGVTRGVRDYFYKLTQPESGWKVHRITAMHRPDWTAEERVQKMENYGSRDHPDYRRNILGLHGDAQSAMFVLTRLMACVDENQSSTYNAEEYYHFRVSDERLKDTGLPIQDLLEFPEKHKKYDRFWVGIDVGMTNHPTEILIFAEDVLSKTGGEIAGRPDVRLKLIARLHLERISAGGQKATIERVFEYYRPQCIAMDSTGLGLPIYQDIVEGKNTELGKVIRGYNFSAKILVGWQQSEQDPEVWWETEEDEEIHANVLEYSSDMARKLVDEKRIWLPWDIELIREMQGQTYTVSRTPMNAYGKKEFNKGTFHALDALRMAALGYYQERIDALTRTHDRGEPVFDSFVM